MTKDKFMSDKNPKGRLNPETQATKRFLKYFFSAFLSL